MKKNILGIFILFGGDICDYRNDQSKVFERVQHSKPHQVVQLYASNEPGVAFVIITGGIDLSIGSVVGLVAVVLSICLKLEGMDPWSAIGITLALSLADWISTWRFDYKSKSSAFVVTLCGLLVYRSMGRWFTDNQSIGPIPLEGDAGYANLEQIQGSDFVFSGKIAIGSFNLPTPAIFLLYSVPVPLLYF